MLHQSLKMQVNPDNLAVSLSEPYKLKRPAVVIRGISHLHLENDYNKIHQFLNKIPYKSIQYIRDEEKSNIKRAVVIFDTEEAAWQTYLFLYKAQLEGKKPSISYVEMVEPIVRMRNIPNSVTEDQIKKILHAYSQDIIERKELKSSSDSATKTLLLRFQSIDKAEFAMKFLKSVELEDGESDSERLEVSLDDHQTLYDCGKCLIFHWKFFYGKKD